MGLKFSLAEPLNLTAYPPLLFFLTLVPDSIDILPSQIFLLSHCDQFLL